MPGRLLNSSRARNASGCSIQSNNRVVDIETQPLDWFALQVVVGLWRKTATTTDFTATIANGEGKVEVKTDLTSR